MKFYKIFQISNINNFTDQFNHPEALTHAHTNQARVQGGGPKEPGTPLEIEKKKRKKKVIRANFNLFYLYFATFLVENVIFSATF